MPRRSILITGGAGFVGSHFARLAHESRRRVIVLDDLSGGDGSARLPAEIPLVVGDVADRALVSHLIRDADVGAVAHFAGRIDVAESVRDPLGYFDVNLVRTLALLDVSRREEVRGVLFSSTAAVYGNPDEIPIPEGARLAPINPYGASKLAVELALASVEAASGIRWAALRYFNAAGAHRDGTMPEAHSPETHLLPRVIDAGLGRGPKITVFGRDYDTPDGTCIRDYVHVEDLAAAHLAALEQIEAGCTVGPVNLGAGKGHSVAEVIAAVERALGAPVPHVFGARRRGDPARLVADASLAAQVLSWKPERSNLDTIVEDALRSRRDRIRAARATR